MDFGHGNSAMNFTENQQGTAILDKLRIQKNAGKFCDVAFHVEQKQYLAHANVLAASSPYFDSVLKDEHETQTGRQHLNVTCQGLEVFEILLDYLYTGKVVIDRDNVSELLRLANHFAIYKLKNYCSEYLERNLHVSNSLGVLGLAERCSLPGLVKVLEMFLTSHLNEVIHDNEILTQELHRLEGFLTNRNLPLTQEMKLFIITRWIHYDTAQRGCHHRPLISLIQWSNINNESLFDMISSEPLYQQDKWCLYFVLKTLEENGISSEIYKDSFDLLKGQIQENTQQVLETDELSENDKDLTRTVSEHSQHEREGQESYRDFDTTQNAPTTSTHVKQESGNNVSLACDSSLEGTQKSDVVEKQTRPDDDFVLLSSVSNSTRSGALLKKNLQKGTGKVQKVANNEKTSNCNKIKSTTGLAKTRRRGRPPKGRKASRVNNQEKKGKGIKMKITKSKSMSDEVVHAVSLEENHERDTGILTEEEFEEKEKDEDYYRDEIENEPEYIEAEQEEHEDNIESVYEGERGRKDDDDDLEFTPPTKRTRSQKVLRNAQKQKCTKCFYVASNMTRLHQHMEAAHKNDHTYKCNICSFETQWNREYYTHMKSHFAGPPYKCDTENCDYTVDRIQPLLYHRMIHTDERPYICEQCGMKFRTKNNLHTHERCHTGEKPFMCPVCNRSFATKSTLEQHSVTHSDDRPYLCDTCGFSTKYQSHLISHKRIHTGDVFRCQHPNCTYFTPKRSQLTAHMRTHMSIRSHICSTCGRAFVEKSHLVRHERIHLEQKPFCCDQCDYGSTRRDKLKEHVLKHHGDNATAKIPYKPRKSKQSGSFNSDAYLNQALTATSGAPFSGYSMVPGQVAILTTEGIAPDDMEMEAPKIMEMQPALPLPPQLNTSPPQILPQDHRVMHIGNTDLMSNVGMVQAGDLREQEVYITTTATPVSTIDPRGAGLTVSMDPRITPVSTIHSAESQRTDNVVSQASYQQTDMSGFSTFMTLF